MIGDPTVQKINGLHRKELVHLHVHVHVYIVEILGVNRGASDTLIFMNIRDFLIVFQMYWIILQLYQCTAKIKNNM